MSAMNQTFRPPRFRFLLCHLSGAPGAFKEAALLCEALERSGHEALLVSYDVNALDRYVDGSTASVLTPAQAVAKMRDRAPTLALFWSNSLFNVLVARRLAAYGAVITVAVHEPKKKWEHVSLIFRAKRMVADFMQAAMCSMSSTWFVFSANGHRLMQPLADKAGANLVDLALYQKDYFDDATLVAEAEKRDWICLAGKPGGSSGHEDWPVFAATVKRAFPSLQPVLFYANSEGSPDWLGANDLAAAGVLNNPSIITDTDVRDAFKRSVAVIRLDRSCTQSGTTPVANSAGAPVIGRNVPGISQHIVSGETGFVLDDMRDAGAIEAAIGAIQKDIKTFVANARRQFANAWGERALEVGVSRLVAAAAAAQAVAPEVFK
ncbi:MAG: hypothetical protein WDN76_08675 [Alphaproteobacteria bacterium]